MKLRHFFIFAMAILMAFSFVSCKQEPEPQPQPQPQPTTETIYKVSVTKGVNAGYYSYDKLKLYWEEEVKAGDTVTLQYRSERAITQWDIRDGSTKWVYEYPHNDAAGFTAPVLGEDGWYTLTYTFSDKDYKGTTDIESADAFGINFRGNWIEGDTFEIKNIKLNGAALEVDDEILTSNGTVEEVEAHDWTIAANSVVVFATGEPGEVDKTPYVEKVAVGGKISGTALPAAEAGYELKLYSDKAKTTEFDVDTVINADTVVYYEYKSTTPAPEPTASAILTIKAAADATFAKTDRFQFKLNQSFNTGEAIEFKVKVSDISFTPAITVRQAGNGDTKFVADVAFSGLTADEDGYYTISVPAEKVVAKDSSKVETTSGQYIGFSFGIPAADADKQKACEICIKDLKLNGTAVDLSAQEAASYVKEYSGSPSAFAATIV